MISKNNQYLKSGPRASLKLLMCPALFEGLKTPALHNLHGYTVHQQYPTLYFPTNAHNVKKNVELLKHFKIRKLRQHEGTAHTPHSSQYAAITLLTSCPSSTYPLLTKCVILAKY